MKMDNELIAEFMGIKVAPYTHYLHGDVTAIVPEEGCIDWPMLTIYCPDKSWDWLMPVVEKIESDPLMDVCIFKEATQIRRWDGSKEVFEWKILEPDGSSKIAHVYRAVIKTIQWYNSQKD